MGKTHCRGPCPIKGQQRFRSAQVRCWFRRKPNPAQVPFGPVGQISLRLLTNEACPMLVVSLFMMSDSWPLPVMFKQWFLTLFVMNANKDCHNCAPKMPMGTGHHCLSFKAQPLILISVFRPGPYLAQWFCSSKSIWFFPYNITKVMDTVLPDNWLG